MLQLTPQVSFRASTAAGPRPFAVALWLSRVYGYVYSETATPIHEGVRRQSLIGYELLFTRNDEPGARRRAEWMRNPGGDPQLQPPVSWHVNGGPGFWPPGWHPAVRLIITPEVEASLRHADEQFARKLNLGWLGRLERSGQQSLPTLPPPPPPPDTIAYPEGQ